MAAILLRGRWLKLPLICIYVLYLVGLMTQPVNLLQKQMFITKGVSAESTLVQAIMKIFNLNRNEWNIIWASWLWNNEVCQVHMLAYETCLG